MNHDDGPLFATVQELTNVEETYNAIMYLTKQSLHYDLTHPINDDIVKSRTFQIANEVRDLQSGRRFKVHASIYYDFAKEWYYILFDKDDPDKPFEIMADSQLLNTGYFAELYSILCHLTEKDDWYWNALIGMFQRKGSPSRRVRITDVIQMKKDAQDGNTVPY